MPPDVVQREQHRPVFTRLQYQVLVIVVVLGLAVRLLCVWLAPQRSYVPDHLDNMSWSAYAFAHGPWTLYETPQPQFILCEVIDPRTADRRSPQTAVRYARVPHAYNYPPLSAFIFWFQGAVWTAVDDRVMTPSVAPREAAQAQRLGIDLEKPSRVANRFKARLAAATPGILFDVLLAAGVTAIVSALQRDKRSRTAELIAFAVTFLAPPIFLDSAFWNSTDAWVACFSFWTLAFVLRERWTLAGVFYGAALMTKPQAILLGPALLFIFLAHLYITVRGGHATRRATAFWKMIVASIVTVVIIAAPFMIYHHSHTARQNSASNVKRLELLRQRPVYDDGNWVMLRWFKRSYLDTVFGDMYPRTTLHAFNLWWLDYLSNGAPRDGAEHARFISSKETVFGLTKDQLGKRLLAACIVLIWLLCAWRWKGTRQAWLACATVVALAAFALPTRVHERYVYYSIPGLIALAVVAPRWVVPLVLILIVGSFEMVSFRWARLGGLYSSDGLTTTAYMSVALAIGTLVALVWALALLAWGPRANHVTPSQRSRRRRGRARSRR